MPRATESTKPKSRLIGTFALLALFLTGCTSEELPRFGMPVPATEEAKRILVLWQGSWVAALIVGALVWGLMIWAIIFFRRRGDHLPAQTKYNVPLEVLYTIVPFIIVAVLFYFTARDEAVITKVSSDTTNVHVIKVNGIRWSWQFTYPEAGNATVTGTPAAPPVLYVPQGERVQFELTTSDVNHSFWIPAFLMKMDNIAGRTNKFEVTPTKLGTYPGKCAELCGRQHYRMIFTVKVVTPSEYQSYLDSLKGAQA